MQTNRQDFGTRLNVKNNIKFILKFIICEIIVYFLWIGMRNILDGCIYLSPKSDIIVTILLSYLIIEYFTKDEDKIA